MVLRKATVLMITLVSVLGALALATAASASAAQRIDMKVLLLGTSTTEPNFVSWQAALQREGVPFETIVTSPGHAPITAATLSDTLANGT
jgi:ABC-type sugar transport system substrate-binding protein